MNRLSGLFTSLAFLLLFHLFGFESGDNPGAQPGTASRFLLTVFPMVMMVISLGFSIFLKFSNQRDEQTDLPQLAEE
jgi:GPH family glycoside/pentoside/hexuronide:cation symporter